MGGFTAGVRRSVIAGRGLVLAAACGAAVLSSGCAVVWTGHVTVRSSGFGADAPVPALAIADYMRDLEALTKQPAAQSDAALQAMATRPLRSSLA